MCSIWNALLYSRFLFYFLFYVATSLRLFYSSVSHLWFLWCSKIKLLQLMRQKTIAAVFLFARLAIIDLSIMAVSVKMFLSEAMSFISRSDAHKIDGVSLYASVAHRICLHMRSYSLIHSSPCDLCFRDMWTLDCIWAKPIYLCLFMP